MCGIVGFITDSKTDTDGKERFIKEALIIDTLRGADSTGAFSVQHGEHFCDDASSVSWFKAVVDGYAYTQKESFDKYFSKPEIGNVKYVVGHNRHATIGGVSLNTAHPFRVGPITLVHNGTLDTTYNLPVSQKEAGTFNDSHTIAHNLSLVSPDGAKDILEDLWGAYALVWHDSRDDSLNIVRNDERPFHMALGGWANTIYFASEGEMLQLLNARLHLDLKSILEPDPGYWLKFHPNNLKPVVKKVAVGYSWFSHGYYYGGSTNLYRNNSKYVREKSPAGFTSGLGSQQKDSSTKTEDKIPFHSSEPKELKVSLNGTRNRSVPQVLKEELFDSFEVVGEERIAFYPDSIHGVTKGSNSLLSYGTVKGILLHPTNDNIHEANAIMYNVSRSTFERSKNRVWSGFPYAVFCDDADPQTKTVIMKFESSFSPSGHYTTKDNFVHDNWEEEEKENKYEIATLYKGPNDSYISAVDWILATKDGCFNCYCALSLKNAATCTWVNSDTGNHDVCCPDCSIDLGLIEDGR